MDRTQKIYDHFDFLHFQIHLVRAQKSINRQNVSTFQVIFWLRRMDMIICFTKCSKLGIAYLIDQYFDSTTDVDTLEGVDDYRITPAEVSNSFLFWYFFFGITLHIHSACILHAFFPHFVCILGKAFSLFFKL